MWKVEEGWEIQSNIDVNKHKNVSVHTGIKFVQLIVLFFSPNSVLTARRVYEIVIICEKCKYKSAEQYLYEYV